MKADKPIIGKDYYIPSINEFHIGFDYELYRGGVWEKHILSIDDTFYHTHTKFPVYLRVFIEDGECRRLKTNKCSFCGK